MLNGALAAKVSVDTTLKQTAAEETRLQVSHEQSLRAQRLLLDILQEMNHRAADERSEKDGRFIDARFVSEFAEVFEVQHLELSADDRRVLCTYLRRICRKEKYYRTANAALLFGFIRDSVPMSEPGAPRPSDRLCEADIAQILNVRHHTTTTR